jgi:hypothetical protein
MRTFKGKNCLSRTVNRKVGILADRIVAEITDIERIFTASIEKATGVRIKWHRLDLSNVAGRAAQIAAIASWGRVGVKMELGGGISVN